jgi:CHAT domain-containing protein
VELELGLAYAAANQIPQGATELQKSLLAAGQYDHALTGMSLLELGRLALEQGKFEAAITYFHEATISGIHFERYDVVEEAFRLAAEAHLLSRKPGVYPPLTAAVNSPIMRRSRVLQVSLLASLAEHLCSAGDTSGAAAALAQARNAMVRREMSQGAAGSRVNYQAARLALHGGDAKAAGSSLASALTYQRASCKRLFQIGLVDGLYLSGAVTERVADQLYSDALREPTPIDWTLDPLDTLAMISTPHPLPYEHWFELALGRKEQEKALNIAERIRRHRFLTTQPLGGRLIALRWQLEGPPETLSPAAMLQRQDLLVKYSKSAELSRRAAEIKVQLQALPVAPRQDSQLKEQTNLLSELAKVSVAQESLLQLIALERVPSEFAFPPLRDTKQIQRELPDGTLVFYYFATSQNVHAFALTADRYGAFTVAQPAKVKADVAEMLRQMGNHDRTQPVDAEDLKANGWVAPAERLMSQLTNNTQQADWAKYRELVVVPDGVLWYLPFEALPVPGEDAKRPLLLTLPMRYSPTLGLAMADRWGNRPLARTAVVSSKLLPRDEDSFAAAASETITAALPGSVVINGDWRGSSAVFSTAFDRLIVLRDHEEADKFPFGWSPFLLDAGKPGSTLGEWMQLPFGGVDQIILPGVHTPAEYALKRGGTGDEIFLASCGLMASGCRTILMSRWRVGGQSTVELMREFAQELPHVPAANAWRRSVQLTSSRVLDPSLEGRLKSSGGRTLTADHPFFWSGYMLIDAGGAPTSEEKEDAQESLSKPARP